MNETVDLLWLSDDTDVPTWPLGEARCVAMTPKALKEDVQSHLQKTAASFLLFWDSHLGVPQPELIRGALAGAGDVWHAGLRLGMSGQPKMIDFVAPTWMLNRDPDPDIDATSWRLTLRASLIRTRVLREVGGLCGEFQTLDGASCEMGHRYITRGVIVRHLPSLLPEKVSIRPPELSIEDEVRFISRSYGMSWTAWSLFRAVFSRHVSLRNVVRCWRLLARTPVPERAEPYSSPEQEPISSGSASMSVSVLLPTLERYDYLRKLLAQLREQTIRPLEILVVDQTPVCDRASDLADEFSDLPINVTYLDHAGQCSSRNIGLQKARGNCVLFLDDDDEVPPTLIEKHLETLRRYGAPVSSGVAHEVGAGPLPPNFTYPRISDVFPTNNTMIERSVLFRSGLFDLAYERGQRADGDLGMRVYLTGALMILNTNIAVLHHHAPRGGLRAHGARVITYASSRRRLMHRHLPSATEIYLAMRYFSEDQVREMLWLRVFGTLRARGGLMAKLAKILVGLFLLPHTLWRIRKTYIASKRMFQSFPKIPILKQEPLSMNVGLDDNPIGTV